LTAVEGLAQSKGSGSFLRGARGGGITGSRGMWGDWWRGEGKPEKSTSRKGALDGGRGGLWKERIKLLLQGKRKGEGDASAFPLEGGSCGVGGGRAA